MLCKILEKDFGQLKVDHKATLQTSMIVKCSFASMLKWYAETTTKNKSKRICQQPERGFFSVTVNADKRAFFRLPKKRQPRKGQKSSKQGAYLKREVSQWLTQNELINMPEERIKFLIKSIYDLLPTPPNKNK